MIKKKDVMKCKRKHTPLPENLENIPLLQEVKAWTCQQIFHLLLLVIFQLAYLSHKEEIKTHLLQKQKWEKQERLDAKKNSLMETCNCCYDEEVMPKDTYNCPNGCKFCKECIKKSCEVALGEGKTDFPCLADCSAEFTLQTLQVGHFDFEITNFSAIQQSMVTRCRYPRNTFLPLNDFEIFKLK